MSFVNRDYQVVPTAMLRAGQARYSQFKDFWLTHEDGITYQRHMYFYEGSSFRQDDVTKKFKLFDPQGGVIGIDGPTE